MGTSDAALLPFLPEARTYSTYCHKAAKLQKARLEGYLGGQDSCTGDSHRRRQMSSNWLTTLASSRPRRRARSTCVSSERGRFKVLSYLHQLVRYSLIEEWLANPDGGNGQGGLALLYQGTQCLHQCQSASRGGVSSSCGRCCLYSSRLM